MNLKGKKIVITGGAGFIGSYLSKHLDKKKANVYIVDLKEKPKDLPKSITCKKGDIRDQNYMCRLLKNTDVLYHMAAVFGSGRFIHNNQAHILNYNLQLYDSIFNAAKRASVGRVVFPSSSIVYNEALTRPAHETDVDNYSPTKNPYGFMKLVGEYYCRYYQNENKLPYTIVRMFNVYGAGDTHSHVIPNFAREALSGQYPFEVMGEGKDTRVFTHIKDIVRGLELIASSKSAINEVYNLSSEREISIVDLAKIIWEFSGNDKPFKVKFIAKPDTLPSRRAANSSKIKKALGWKPEISLEEGILEVIKWIKNSKK